MTTPKTLNKADLRRSFRVLLKVLAEPGTIRRFATHSAYSSPLATGAVVLTDLLAPVAGLDERAQRLAGDVARATGASVVDADQARIALAMEEAGVAKLERLSTGVATAPETACLLFQQVEALKESGQEAAVSLRLSGPGVRESVVVGIAGLSREFFAARNRLCEKFPCGIDIFLISPAGQVMAIPRSTTIEEV